MPRRRAAANVAWPSGGRRIPGPDRLTADWSFGADSDTAVRARVQPGSRSPARGAGRALVIGCGALARELVAVVDGVPGLDVACLAPDLHNRPDGIPAAVRRRIERARADGYGRVFVAYADCGTGGLLDPILDAEGVERLPGAHCYEVLAGGANFAAMAEAEPGTFWLTDFLARNFDRLVIRGLGIDRHPELLATYFAHYRRVVYLSQATDPDLLVAARRAAERLGLAFEHRAVGIANLAAPIEAWARLAPPAAVPRATEQVDAKPAADTRTGLDSARGSRPAEEPRTKRPVRARLSRRTGARDLTATRIEAAP